MDILIITRWFYIHYESIKWVQPGYKILFMNLSQPYQICRMQTLVSVQWISATCFGTVNTDTQTICRPIGRDALIIEYES